MISPRATGRGPDTQRHGGSEDRSRLHRLSRSSAEGGLQPKEYYAKVRSRTASATSAPSGWHQHGLRECHNHNSIPSSPKTFTRLKPLADIKEDGLIQDVGPTAFQPKMLVYGAGPEGTIDTAQALVDTAKKILSQRGRILHRSAASMGKRGNSSVHGGRSSLAVSAAYRSDASQATLTIQKKSSSRSANPLNLRIDGRRHDQRDWTQSRQRNLQRNHPARSREVVSLAVENRSDDSLAGANISRGSDVS